MKLFEELREKRGPNDLVTKEEKKLVNKIFFLLALQKVSKEKNGKEKDKIDNLVSYYGGNKKNNQEIDVLKLLEHLKIDDEDSDNNKISNDNDNINKFPNELNQDVIRINNPSFPEKRNNFLGDCFRGMYNCFFKKVDNSDYEGLNLHKSIAIIIIQNLLLLLSILIHKPK